LQMMIEFGLVGVSLFVSLHFAVLRLLWNEKTQLALYASGGVIFLLFAHLSVTIADDFLSWVVLGTALAVAAQKRSEIQPRVPVQESSATQRYSASQ
jgi:hypothetical protein